MWQANEARVEELDSDDTDTQGVGLNFKEKRFASDPLHFTGIDLSSNPRARRAYAYDTEDSSDSEMSEVEGTNALQVALRDKEEALVQSALARIRRAQEKGKREVKLNQDELDALEKRRKRMQAAATTKPRKDSAGSGGSGSEKRRKNDKHLITVPIAEPSSRKKGKSKRSEEVLRHPPGASNPPGMLVAGPDGALTYAPVGYYPPQESSSRSSPVRPRSANQQVRGEPPPQLAYPAGSSSRHFSEGMRPTSSSSNSSRRPLPDDESWLPAHSRRSSVSSQPVDPFEYQTSSGHPPSIPQQYLQQGRRNVSGPEIAYSSLRRSPPVGGGYPAAARGLASDPTLRRKSSNRDEIADSANSSSDDEEDESDDLGNGVQVFVEEREKTKERAVVPRKPVGGSSKRKGRR